VPVSASPVSGPLSPVPDPFPRPASSEDRFADLDRELQSALGPQYAVEQRIGEGGFAMVFLVRDLSLGRRLAVKVLSPDMALSRTGLERFHREAEAIARLSHPNIVPLHFAGQSENLVYLAMQLVEGESLADRLGREGALPVEDTARIFREVASALDLAHRRGIVHRDIKPANILLEHDTGRALVTDFGVAHVSYEEHLTTTGLVVGTPAYFSPEQVGGLPSDGRSDLYSLGLVVYEMLAGALPFGGRVTHESLIHRMAGKPEGIRKRRPEVPAGLDAVVMRCLEPAMESRFQSGADIVKALDGELPVSTGRRAWLGKPAMARRRWMWAVLGVAAAAVVVVGVGLVIGPVTAPQAPVASPGMVAVPAGSYLIGSDDDERARPAHRVPMPSFAIDRTEVTVGAYRQFVERTNAELPWMTEPDSLLPVTGVRWAEASAFCAWRVRGGRLPTEFEWEAAARGLEGRPYPWGDVMDTAAAEIAHPRAAGPLRVRSHPRGDTPLGVSDLVGNVWEWTSSRLLPYPGGDLQPGGDTLYVIRGGSYNSLPAFATGFYRAGIAASPPRRSDIAQTGFRCAVSPPQAAR
jgi:formylglycine-generating enzyme required for sulfatase activity